MYVKPGNYESYYDYGKTMLAKAWGGAKNLLGNVDYALSRAEQIGNVAAPLVAEMAGDRAGSVKQKMDTIQLQIGRARGALGKGNLAADMAADRIQKIAGQI